MTCFHIDTDMGTDDGLALMLADRLLGGRIFLSTVYGNVSIAQATRNALIFRHLLGRDKEWPIYQGAATASDGAAFHARDVHGPDGLGNATAELGPDVSKVVDAAIVHHLPGSRAPGHERVTIVGLGPATNIPHLVSWYGPSRVENVVLMSSVFFDRGNISEYAEFNAYCDPTALAQTVQLGIPVTLVPLDVCRKVQLSRQTLLSYGESNASDATKLLIASHLQYMDFYHGVEGIDGCFPHDAIALLVALEPERFFCITGSVTVEAGERARGKTTVLLGEGDTRIVTGGDLHWVRDMLRSAPQLAT